MATETMIFRTATEDDWRQLRDLRLEMLADTPIAYGETLAEALAYDEAHWRYRARRGASPESTSIVAIDEASGRWVGNMSGYVDHAGDPAPRLVGVYVHPDFRGRALGIADGLLGCVERWATAYGDSLTLHVHEDNVRAVAFYRRHGYEPTGAVEPYDLDPSRLEIVMHKAL
ncbi:MAG: family N-acetyltransferase [Leifsonia sp.]|jgi:ribosomal protein S18 acetylase RimI-like enzyme|nr:family N-acetyltransferase [Leifsonia sp.]